LARLGTGQGVGFQNYLITGLSVAKREPIDVGALFFGVVVGLARWGIAVMTNPFGRRSAVMPVGAINLFYSPQGSHTSVSLPADRASRNTLLGIDLPGYLGYSFIEVLGEGAGSSLYAVSGSDGQIYTLKRVVDRSPQGRRFVQQAVVEHEVASQLDHPILRRSIRLIRRRRFFRTREVFVVMEYVDGQPLEWMEGMTVPRACRIFQHISVGLGAMHRAGYVHADMKPNNVLVTDDDRVKIIDFGQSCRVNTVKQRIQGTPDFIAPEQVLRRAITQQTDVFNLGATMYWVLTGQHVPTMMPKQRAGLLVKYDANYPSPEQINPQVPPALSSLVMGCTQSDPASRPSTMARVYERIEMAIAQISRHG
jgi:serine/threonine-protein kinase